MTHRRPSYLAWIVPFAGVLVAVGVWQAVMVTSPALGAEEQQATIASTPEEDGSPVRRYPVITRPGPATPTVIAMPADGSVPSRVSCSTCHTTRTPDVATRTSLDLDEFHQALAYDHGRLSCLSCHNAGNYDTLRHADGTSINYPNAIELCAQCHGTQYRDYTHGSHGGASGFWDLTAGPRTRNTCLDCHDAHSPAYPRVQPVFPPQDRGARQQRESAAAHRNDAHE